MTGTWRQSDSRALAQTRRAKENMLKQRACAIWMCGFSGAGKTTLAVRLDHDLYQRGYLSQVIDGDSVRHGLNRELGFSMADRQENLRRVAEVAKLFISSGVIAIVSFISPTCELRAMAKSIIGEQDFMEVFVDASLERCESRDTKGLYKLARQGVLADFTGISHPFEPPPAPDLIVDTESISVEQSSAHLLNYVLKRITI
jgi:adenylylsulfate kinase